jgi:hypothetical protein
MEHSAEVREFQGKNPLTATFIQGMRGYDVFWFLEKPG